jgi:hypothetical protein
MKARIYPRAATNPAAPQRFRLLRAPAVPSRDVGPRCAVRRGSKLKRLPRLRRGRASGCAHRAHPLPQAGGPARRPRPIVMGLHGEHEL